MDNYFIITMLMDLIITILGYCTIPIILRILNGKYEYEKGHKIVLINCAIVWLIFTIIKVEHGIKANSAAVFLYYMIDRAILLKPKKDNKGNQSLSFEKNESIKNGDNYGIIIIVALLIVFLIGAIFWYLLNNDIASFMILTSR